MYCRHRSADFNNGIAARIRLKFNLYSHLHEFHPLHHV